jgi:PKD repeat protein
LAVAALAACTTKKTETPALSGPSELGLSLALSASPDQLAQDGSSHSEIKIVARDANSQAKANLTCKVQITVDGYAVDFGRLSNTTVTTGANGEATLTYTAPPASSVSAASTLVLLAVTPLGTDYANSLTRSVSIKIVPSGTIDPVGSAGAYFTYTPEAPTAGTNVTFAVAFCGASDTADCTPSSATSFKWSFGDGATASGSTVVHKFSSAGTYSVTLTVTDAYGWPASSTTPVIVEDSAAPKASFTVTPTSPVVLTDAVFDASGSTAATGRTIVSYVWDFGDGTTKTRTTPTTTHDWVAVGTYPVTLTVTDSAGKQGVSVVAVTVKASS